MSYDFMRCDYHLTRKEYLSMPVNDRINLKSAALSADDAVCLCDFFEDDQTVWLYYGEPDFYISMYTDGESLESIYKKEYEDIFS